MKNLHISKKNRNFAPKFAHLIYETSRTTRDWRGSTQMLMGKEFTTSQPIVALTQKLKNLTDMIDFSKMTDEEFFSPAPKEPFPPQENECIEIHRHKTPSGGDLSIAYFYDKNGTPCSRANAHHMNIVEYKNDGTRINEHYGAL